MEWHFCCFKRLPIIGNLKKIEGLHLRYLFSRSNMALYPWICVVLNSWISLGYHWVWNTEQGQPYCTSLSSISFSFLISQQVIISTETSSQAQKLFPKIFSHILLLPHHPCHAGSLVTSFSLRSVCSRLQSRVFL